MPELYEFSSLAPSFAGGAFASASLSESGDALGTRNTTAVMEVGDTFTGRISSAADSDWVRIDLVAGQSYVFTVYGTGGYAGLEDTVLTLRNASGSFLIENDQVINGNNNSMITFTATQTGSYYLDVDGYESETGQYTLRASTDVFTIDEVASQLVDIFWGFNTAPLHFDVTSGGTLSVNLTDLGAEGRQLARWALEAWSQSTGILFVETGSSLADIVFSETESDGNSNGFFAYAGPDLVDPYTGVISQSRVFISQDWIDSEGTTFGSYGYLTYLHEIGHALGLGHAGFYDGFADYGFDNHYLNDSYQMTIMSYFDMIANTFIDGSEFYPITPMVADLAAIERMYGPLSGIEAGDTTWGANSTIGGTLGIVLGVLFEGDSLPSWMDPSLAFGGTIIDSSGTDTLDFRYTLAEQVIDLRPGSILDVYGQVGTLRIAQGTVIENAIGGEGADTMIGNGADNDLFGNLGADELRGNGGDDRLMGEGQNDTLYGGSGNDRMIGGGGNDRLIGGSGDDRISGSSGRDTVGGGGGNDHIADSSGSDLLSGNGGNDTILGGNGNDRMDGGSGRDVLEGGNDNDRIKGGSSGDRMSGQGGNDTLWGGSGADRVYGGTGDDLIGGGKGSDTMTGGSGADSFVFARNEGDDRITDFNGADGDRLQLSSTLWTATHGALTAEQVENTFGSLNGNGDLVLDFGPAGTSVILLGVTDLESIDQFITIV